MQLLIYIVLFMEKNILGTHFLFVGSPWFGHTRPFFSLAMNLLIKFPSLYITFVTSGTTSDFFSPPFDHEMVLFGLTDGPRSRLSIKLLGEGRKETPLDQVFDLFGLLPEFLSALMNGDGDTEDVFQHRPALAIVDILAQPSIKILDSVSGSGQIPVLDWVPLNAAAVNLYWVQNKDYPETYWPHVYREAEKELASGIHGNITLSHAAYKIWCRPSEWSAQTPSLPPVYNYELNPQTDSLDTGEDSLAVATPEVCKIIADYVPRIAGFVIHTSPAMEPGEVEDMMKTAPNKLFLQVGPQYPAEWWEHGIPKSVQAMSSEDETVLSFLDRMESQYGKESVLYISFGTTFLPFGRPQLFDGLIKTLLEAEPPLPFIFASADRNPLLTPAHRERILKSGRGLLAGFVPQQAVLKHSATGWYLCHGGSNSVSEALLNQVPMVLWPYTIDQPLIANQVSCGLELAFELLQVRNGASIDKPARRGPIVAGTQEALETEMAEVWKDMRGPDGHEMRRRVIEFSYRMREDYMEGVSKKAMEGFSQFLGY